MKTKTVNISVLNNHKDYKFRKKSRISKIFNLVFEQIEIYERLYDLFKTCDNYSLDVVFTDDDEIRKVNKDYRGIDAPTDVITFSLFADDTNSIYFGDSVNLGEIIISFDTAKKQAKANVDDEINLLITHGILHLLGFDHQTEEDYNFIVGIQNKIMKELMNV